MAMAYDVVAAADRCRAETGETNPQNVGKADGTEDDFGDLISAAFDEMVGTELDFGDYEDAAGWQRVQDAASAFEGTTMEEFCRMVFRAWYDTKEA